MLSKVRKSTFVGAIVAFSILCYAIAGLSQSPQASVQITTEPSIAQVTPLEAEATQYLGSGQYQSPVQLKLQARDGAGAPLQNARYHLQVLTPAPTPWFTTDFPIVEGTKLLDIEGDSPTGEFGIQQVFPIRGTYQLQVNVSSIVKDAFKPIAQTLTLTVPENPLKFRYFPFVLLTLLTIGFVGGWIIGGRQAIQPGELAPRRVRLLLSGVTVFAIASLLFFEVSAELAQAHNMTHDMTMGVETVAPTSLVQSQGLQLELTGDNHTAVGKTAAFQAKLIDRQTNQPVNGAIVEVKSTQLENNWIAFAYQGISDAKGLLAWQEQFFDGAPHKVEVKVSPQPNGSRQFQAFVASREIEVEGIAPPLSVRFISLIYFTAVLALGLMAGLWLQHRRMQAA